MVEDRLVGIKSREVYEAPGAIALITAHQELENVTVERDLARFKRRVEQRWAELVYDGLWFSPLKRALDAFIDETQQHVTGEIRMTLHGGRAVVDRPAQSEQSLYDFDLATYDTGDTFDQSLAKGFVELWGLSSKIAAARRDQRQGRADGRMTAEPRAGDRCGCGAAGSPAARPTRWPRCRASTHFDWRLAPYDLAGSRAHARVLHAAGLLDRRRARRACSAALDRARRGRRRRARSLPAPADEDVHTALERGLIERLGADSAASCAPAAAATTRSPPTLPAVPARPRPAASPRLVARPRRTRWSARPSAHAGRGRCPGCTHLQHAQPVLLAPPPAGPRLGAAARRRPAARLGPRARRLAARRGRARRLVAARSTRRRWPRELGFAGAVEQLDRRASPTATSSPSSPFVAAMIGVHLSRLGEEIVLWATRGVRLRHARRRLLHRLARSCRRRRTPTSPSWRAARPAG